MVLTKIPRSIKPAAAAIFWGVGNSNNYYQWGAINKNALEFRLNTLAASGDSRGIYMRMKFSGAGGGEAGRFFASASASNVATGGTINGVHATMSIDASSSVSGAGNALRATLGAAAATRTLSGTCAALQLDSDIGANNTVGSAYSFIRVTDSGSVRLGNLLNMPNAANGTILAAHVTDAMSHSIKFITANGTAYYIMCTTTATNRS